MDSATHRRFLRTLVLVSAFAVLLAAIVSPPDPFSQVLYTGPLLVVALLLSALRTYTGYLDAFDPSR